MAFPECSLTQRNTMCPLSAMKVKTCHLRQPPAFCTGAPVASVAMQNACALDSWNIAATIRYSRVKATASQPHCVERGKVKPCRALMRSWRWSGSTSSYLETMTLEMALGSAITCGKTLGGRGATRTVVVFDDNAEWAASSAATSTALAFEAMSLDATG